MTAKEICRKVDPRLKPQAEILAKQVLEMAKKLEEARKQMKDEPLIVEYDNGGGQTGTRENPFYPAYERLLASFSKSLTTLIGMLGEDSQEAASSLINLRDRLKVV